MNKPNKIPEPGSISFSERVLQSTPYEWGYGSTRRSAKLRNELFWKGAVVKDWLDVTIGMGKMEFRTGITIDMERARIVTRSFKETDGLPRVRQFARMVEKLMDEMPIFIKRGELIVGDPNGAPDKVRWYPETNVEWVPAAVTTGGFRAMMTDEERKEILEEICPFWEKRSMASLIKMNIPRDMKKIIIDYSPSCCCNFWEEGRLLPAYDYEVLFNQGLNARIKKVEDKLRDLDGRVAEMYPGEYILKRQNWEAQAQCGRAILRYTARLAALAREHGKIERDTKKKREFEDIASTLDWVPANPPRTFRECLQFYWIIETTAHYLARWGNGSGTRIDQVWWPYYENDLREGRITREEAIELVECLMIKIQEVGAPLEWPFGFTGGSGAEVFYTSNICGSNPDGSDASNDLSCIIMEALSNVRLTQPPVALRYHKNISPAVVERAIDLCRIGLGHPSFFNEDLLKQWAIDRGWSPEEANDVQVVGCVFPNIKGKASSQSGLVEVGGMSLVGILEEVLHKHAEPLICGPIRLEKTKDPRRMKSSDEIIDAVMERVSFYTRVSVVSWNIAQQVLMNYKVDPCNSFLLDEPLERGIDLLTFNKEGDTWPNILPFGAMNVSDSLAAIQKLIFDEKKYSIEQLLAALKANWEDHADMHRDFLNAPKFGNDDDNADRWAVKLQVRLAGTMGLVKDAWGSPVSMDGSVATGYALYGLANGASPDGRRAGTPLADGTRSPVAGMDKQGPTAVMKSAGKIPYIHPDLLNQRFMPQFMQGENRKIFADYLRTWYAIGTVPHVQFNVISSEALKDAKVHPDKHSELIVRVAGYSAHFIDLPEISQDSIIRRTEQCFGRRT